MTTFETTTMSLSPWQYLSACRSYTEVRFSVNGSAEVRGMVRDLPNHNVRRITNLDHGTEFFAEPDTVYDTFEVTAVPIDRQGEDAMQYRAVVEALTGQTVPGVDVPSLAVDVLSRSFAALSNQGILKWAMNEAERRG